MADGLRHRLPQSARGRWLLGGVALAAVVVLVLLVAGVFGGGEDYWDGGEWGGAVISADGQLTEEAHQELEECGRSDDDAVEVATSGGITQQFEVEEGKVESSGAIESREIDTGIYEIECLGDVSVEPAP